MMSARDSGLQGLGFESASASHIGKVREENQDDLVVRQDLGLWAVADGVGGLQDGRHASSTLVEALAAIRPPASATDLMIQFEQQVAAANRDLRQYAETRSVSLGTTIVALLTHGNSYACAWAGDSRLYRLRGGTLELLSEDHTEANELVTRGVLSAEEARTWPRRNVITRAVGVEDDVDLEVRKGTLFDGDVFLLCSDGLTTHLDDRDILNQLRGRNLQQACDALIQLTLDRGAKDNVTVVVVGVKREVRTMQDVSDLERTVLMIPRRSVHD